MKPKILKDLKTGQEYVLKADHRKITIGRNPENYIALEDGRVSRNHAIVVHESDGTVFIYDINSTNGTFVKRGRDKIIIVNGKEQIFPGDIIRLGADYNMQLVSEDVESEKKAKHKKMLEDTVIDPDL